jgi:hypothetical protein
MAWVTFYEVFFHFRESGISYRSVVDPMRITSPSDNPISAWIGTPSTYTPLANPGPG